MSSPSPVLVWLRNNLRLADNPALAAACEAGRPVVPLYILDETGPGRRLGGASRWWLDKSLASLARDIEACGGRLVLRRGQAQAVLEDLIGETGADTVLWNRLYDPASTTRDEALKARFKSRGIDCRSFNAALLSEPWTVRTGAGGPFKVFSAYWRAAAPHGGDTPPLPAPPRIPAPAEPVASDPLRSWGLHPRRPDWSGGFSIWTPGEAGARARLDAFMDGAAGAYDTDRDRPDLEGTSRLSPHLRFGEIGPRQVWRTVSEAMELDRAPRKALETFLKELGWREFNHQLLYNFPRSLEENLDPRFDAFEWREDEDALDAWRRGQTGYPIVDAAMRQLWRTGWMHNRARMIVASFLVKDLLIHWKTGEAWFWDTLVDADLANNVGGWQWTAGSGADAAPYFRVFNPILQGERFDPHGEYVRKWIPELARLPDDCIQKPWSASAEALASAGVKLDETYPRPIVDHHQARERALALYERLP
jgi:deoxyribodipyrimidine photo-lyase